MLGEMFPGGKGYQEGEYVPEMLAMFNRLVWKDRQTTLTLFNFVNHRPIRIPDLLAKQEEIGKAAQNAQIPELLFDHVLLSLIPEQSDKQQFFQGRYQHYYDSLEFISYMTLGFAHGLTLSNDKSN